MNSAAISKIPSNSSKAGVTITPSFDKKKPAEKAVRGSAHTSKKNIAASVLSFGLALVLSIAIGAEVSIGNRDETSTSVSITCSTDQSPTMPSTSNPPTTALTPRIGWKASVDLVPATSETQLSSCTEPSLTETSVTEPKEFDCFESLCKDIERFFSQYLNLQKTGSLTFSDELGFDYERWIGEKENASSLYRKIIACRHLVKGTSNLNSKLELINLYIDYALELEEKKEYYNAENNYDTAILLLLDLASYKNSPIAVSDIAFRLGDIYEHKSLLSNDNESFLRLLYTSGAYYKIATGYLYSSKKTLYGAKYALYYGTILLRAGLIMDKSSSPDIRWYKAAEPQYHQSLQNKLSSSERTRCINELNIIKERLYPFSSSLD